MSALPDSNTDNRKNNRIAANVQAKIYVGLSTNPTSMNGIIHFNSKGASIYLPQVDEVFSQLKEKTKCCFEELILFSELGSVTINKLDGRFLRQTKDNYGYGNVFDYLNTDPFQVEQFQKALEMLESSKPVSIAQKRGLSLLPME